MKTILERLGSCMLIPVIALENADFSEDLASALCRAGIPAAEVTFRTAAAAEVIARMKKARPDMLVGAGTVLTPEQADRAKAAGAEFLVAPGLNPSVVAHAQAIGVPMVPGVCTPSEIERGLELGLTTLKFFPAEASGGLAMIKAVSAPYGMVRFMPTGGINEENVGAYLANEKILCCGGSWIVPSSALKSGDAGEVERLTRAAVKKMLGITVRSVSGMDRQEAGELLKTFLPPVNDALPEPVPGPRELVLETPLLFRAVPFAEGRGLRAESVETDEKGKLLRASYPGGVILEQKR